MEKTHNDLSQKLLGRSFDELSELEKNVIRTTAQRIHVSKNVNKTFEQQLTFGQKLADQVAAFGGSWPFIIIFFVVLLVWVLSNTLILGSFGKAFDPYPFILLNLVLSMLASIQAPIIMMSQNRQAAKDRMDAAHDYEVNLKAELEIIDLHHEMDELKTTQRQELMEIQKVQLQILDELRELNTVKK
jgi:uncharacterized membrane protein